MQLQIECNRLPGNLETCLICQNTFMQKDAQVILCNDQGRGYGEVCSHCLGRGLNWIGDRFNQLYEIRKLARL